MGNVAAQAAKEMCTGNSSFCNRVVDDLGVEKSTVNPSNEDPRSANKIANTAV